MCELQRRRTLFVVFVVLSSTGVFAEDGDPSASSFTSPALLRASNDDDVSASNDDDVSALGGKGKSGGDVIGHRSRSKRNYQQVGQIDTVLATIVVEGACPADFTLSNNQCIQTGPSDISCPEGFTEEESAFPGATPEVIFRNRTCAFFAMEIVPSVQCGVGILEGISCFEFEAVAPNFVGCDPGFVLGAQGCVFTEVAPISAPRCEQGELGPGNDCFDVQVVDITFECEDLAFLGEDGQTCVTRTAAGPATTGCPEGFTFAADDQCSKTETAGTVPTCEGLSGSLQGGQCVEFEAVAAEANCGEGFNFIDNGCIAFQNQAPLFTCPPGFTSVSDVQCEREIEVPPIAQCSVYEAFFDAELQACVIVTQGPPSSLECEQGAVVRDGECAFVEQAASTAFCADPDFILANSPSEDAQVCQKCISMGIIGGGIHLEENLLQEGRGGHHGHRAHKHTVEEGKEDQETDSIKPNTAEEEPSTNVKTSDVEVTEEVTKEQDLTSGQLPPTANSTTYRRDHHGGHHQGGGTRGDGDGDGVLGGGETFECTTSAPAFQCQSGFVLSDDGVGQTCLQVEVAAGINVCDFGFTLASDQTACEARTEAPAIFNCDAGFTLSADSSSCALTERSGKDTECPPGSELSGNVCLNVRITQEAVFFCGPGRELRGSECIAAAAVAAGVACPEGFTFGPGDDATCTRTTTQPGQRECEAEGANLEGDECFLYPGVAATATCGEGILTGLQCQIFNLIAPAVVCAAGFEQVDSTCVRENVEFPNIECPPGAFVQDGQCVQASGIAAEVTCPIGLVGVPIRENTEYGCFELTAPSASCPFGQEVTLGGECIINAIAPSDTPASPPLHDGHFGQHGAHGGHTHKKGEHNTLDNGKHH